MGNSITEFKKNKATGISKRDLSDKTGINHNSITKWHNVYLKEGIQALLTHGRIGFKKSILDSKAHKSLERPLNDPENGIRGYRELQQWVSVHLHIEVEYSTLYISNYKKQTKSKKVTATNAIIQKNSKHISA